jgi:hypothetical protein
MVDPLHGVLNRKEPDPGGLVSLLVSLGLHALAAALVLTLAFFARHETHAIAAPPPDPPTDLVEAESLDPPPGSTEADALAGGKAQSAPAAPPAAAEAPPAKPIEEPLPANEAPAKATEAPTEASRKAVEPVDGPVDEPDPVASALPPKKPHFAIRGPKEDTSTDASATPATAPAQSSNASGAGTGDGTSNEGDGGHARTAPSLAARFTKELAPYAAHVPSWQTMPTGATASAEITLELDADGHVVKDRDPLEGVVGAPDAIAESVRRTQKSMLLVFSLPDRPVGAGTVTLRIRGDVSDRDPPSNKDSLDPNGIEYAFTFEGKKGAATFTLASGRHVELSVEIVRVEARN